MTPVSFVFGNTVKTWKFASTLMAGMAAALLYLILQKNTTRVLWAIFLMCLVVLEPHSFRTVQEHENGFVFFASRFCYSFGRASSKMIKAPLRRSYIGLGIAAGMLPFARPELAVFSLGLILSACDVSFQISRTFLGGVLLFVAPLRILNMAAFGSRFLKPQRQKRSF